MGLKVLLITATLLLFMLSGALALSTSSNTSISTLNLLNSLNPKCTPERMAAIELAVARMVGFGPHGRQYPETLAKVAPFCKETTRLVRQVETFIKQCLRRKDIADLTAVILYSVKSSLVRQYCGRARSRKRVANLIKVSPCLNRHFLPQDRCITGFINATAALVALPDDGRKIPHTCCNYVRTLGCFEAQIEAQPCLLADRERILTIIKGLFNGVTDLMCGEYTEATDRCRQLGPPPSAPLGPKNNSRHYASFIFLLTDLLASTASFSSPT